MTCLAVQDELVLMGMSQPEKERNAQHGRRQRSMRIPSPIALSWRFFTALSSDDKAILVRSWKEVCKGGEKNLFKISLSAADQPGFQHYVEERVGKLLKSGKIHEFENALRATS